MTTDPLDGLAVRIAEQPDPDPERVEVIRQRLMAAFAAEHVDSATPSAMEQRARLRRARRQPSGLTGGRGRPIRRLVIGSFVAVVAVLIAVGGVYVGSRSSKPPGIPATPAEITAYLDSLGGAIYLSSSPQPSLPRGTVVDGRLQRPIIIDGGQMGIAPPPAGVGPRFSLGQASAQAHRAESGLGYYAQVGSAILGLVWMASDLTEGLPSYQGRLAWVALTAPSLVGGSGPFCTVSPLEVVVFDAATGNSLLDFAAWNASLCRGQTYVTYPATPRVTTATELLSIPWSAIGEGPNPGQPQYFDWHIRYTIPACGTVRENVSMPTPGHPKAGHQVLGMLAMVPLDIPARCSPARTVTTWFGPEWDPLSRVVHEPLGVTAGGL